MDLKRLEPWNDPIELVKALVDLPKERLSEAKEKLTVLIGHADVDVRVHAFRRLFVHLRDSSRHATALSALRRDPEPKVRRVAAHAISATSTVQTRAQDVSTLLQSLQDQNESVEVRGAAYEALLLLHERKDFPPANRDIDLQKDVDWTWVDLLRAGAKGGRLPS